jgi:hypothetical protein
MTFTPFAQTAGGQGPAALYRYIRHCLTLRGGKDHDNRHWVWKTVEEAAEALGASPRSVRRWFLKLVKLGWLVREKLAASSWYQAWFYALGPDAPLAHRGGQKGRADAAKVAASYQGSTPPQLNTPQPRQPKQPEQPQRREAIAPPAQAGWPEALPVRDVLAGIEAARRAAGSVLRPARGFAAG